MAIFWGKNWKLWQPAIVIGERLASVAPQKPGENLLWSGTKWWGLFKFAVSSFIPSLIHFWSQQDPLWGDRHTLSWCQAFIYIHCLINSPYQWVCTIVCICTLVWVCGGGHSPNRAGGTSRSREGDWSWEFDRQKMRKRGQVSDKCNCRLHSAGVNCLWDLSVVR